jgi:hypothetical protein
VTSDSRRHLLAVDLGLRMGLAVFDDRGQLAWYRSTNLGTRARLKKAVPSILAEAMNPSVVVVEGGGPLFPPWERAVEVIGARLIRIEAGTWRRDMLLARHQRSGREAKSNALDLARYIIERTGASKPTGALKDDVAEAILVGAWGVRQLGWMNESWPF